MQLSIIINILNYKYQSKIVADAVLCKQGFNVDDFISYTPEKVDHHFFTLKRYGVKEYQIQIFKYLKDPPFSTYTEQYIWCQ